MDLLESGERRGPLSGDGDRAGNEVRVLRQLGERVHLAGPDVGLATHIEDIVNVLEFEDLNNIVLIGHSYGGMVIAGVAERVPRRIAKLVFMDAILPENGESVRSLFGDAIDTMAALARTSHQFSLRGAEGVVRCGVFAG